MKNKLCIVAGGSGGHITPALVLGETWKQHNPDGSIIFFGNNKKIDKTVLAKQSTIDTHIALSLQNLPGKKLWRYPIFTFQLICSSLKSFFILKKERPRKIISTGGLIAFPVCIAGYFLKIPIHLYELNTIPGLAIKFLAPLADIIHVVFPETKEQFKPEHQDKVYTTNYPLRFTEKDKAYEKKEIIHLINKQTTKAFHTSLKTIFVLGGSQGSLFLNNLIKSWVLKDPESARNMQFIHQIGSYDKTDWHAFYDKHNIASYIFTYKPNIKDLYLASDLVICRGGAGTLFELEFFKKKCLIFPLHGVAANHQVANANTIAARNREIFFPVSPAVNLSRSCINLKFCHQIMNEYSFDS